MVSILKISLFKLGEHTTKAEYKLYTKKLKLWNIQKKGNAR